MTRRLWWFAVLACLIGALTGLVGVTWSAVIDVYFTWWYDGAVALLVIGAEVGLLLVMLGNDGR